MFGEEKPLAGATTRQYQPAEDASPFGIVHVVPKPDGAIVASYHVTLSGLT